MEKKSLISLLYILFLLVLSISILADNETKIVKTTIDVSNELWIEDGNGTCFANLTIKTENAEGESDFKRERTTSFSGATFDIRTIETLSCDAIDLSNFTKECVGYFRTFCEDPVDSGKYVDCSKGYYSMMVSRDRHINSLEECRNDLFKYNQTDQDLLQCVADKVEVTTKYENVIDDNLELEEKGKNQWMWSIGALVIGGVVVYLYENNKGKGPRKKSIIKQSGAEPERRIVLPRNMEDAFNSA